MKFKQKLFVVIGLFLIAAVSGGFYVNYKLNNLVSSLNQPGSMYSDTGSGVSGGDSDASGTDGVGQSGTSARSGNSSVVKNGSSGNSSGNASRPSNGDIASGALSKVNRPVEKEDLIKAGFIILRRLDSGEISYLYQVGMQENHSREQLLKARDILQAKLTAEELAEMQFLGAKYGKNLDFLSQ
jgi:plasmid stability protein